jgi:hypothetical protein
MVGSAFPFERYECPKIYPVIITEKVMIMLLKFDLRNSIVIIIFMKLIVFL